MDRSIKIAMLSFGDIDNYGDTYFAIVFENAIRKRIKQTKIDFFAPVGGSFSGITYKKFSLSKINSYDAVIVAGGEIIHKKDSKTWDPIYSKRGMALSQKNYSDIVWEMYKSTCRFKAFFSVGVLPFESDEHRNLIKDIINNVDFFSVRGVISKKIIENELLYNSKISITPDLGWFFNEYVNDYKCVQNKSIDYFIFQINSINENDAPIISKQLERFASEKKIKCILLPIIKPWEDRKYLEMIYDSFKCKEVVSILDYNDVKKTSSIICNSRFVLGSSLHSAITAMAASIPAGVINKWAGTKFQDIFLMQFKSEYLSNNIMDIYPMCLRLFNQSDSERRINRLYAEFSKERLNKAFDDLSSMIMMNCK